MIPSTAWMDRAMCAQDRRKVKPCPCCGDREANLRWDALTQAHKQRICDGCPVQRECFAWTMKVEKGAGPRSQEFVAGMTAHERRRLYRKLTKS